MAYQRNLRVPQDINPGVVLSAHPMFFAKGAEMPKEEKQELAAPEELPVEELEMAEPTIADVLAMLAEIKSILKPVEEESPVDEKEETIAQMSARITQLEDDKTRMELSVAGITGDRAKHLIKLSRANVELYRDTVRLLSAQQEIGVAGAADIGDAPITASYVASEAVKAGADSPGKLVAFLNKKYPTFVGQAAEVRNVITKGAF
jgi:hypothetical protein